MSIGIKEIVEITGVSCELKEGAFKEFKSVRF